MILKQIPFPAFTICEIGNQTYADSKIVHVWLEVFMFPIFVVSTELGMCRTLNFCDQNKFLQSEVDERRVFKYFFSNFDDRVPENQTRPYTTTSPERGMNVVVFHGHLGIASKNKVNNPFILMIHSPFELPTKKDQQYYMSDMDHDTFFVTPHLTKIDDTMIGMEPHE